MKAAFAAVAFACAVWAAVATAASALGAIKMVAVLFLMAAIFYCLLTLRGLMKEGRRLLDRLQRGVFSGTGPVIDLDPSDVREVTEEEMNGERDPQRRR